MQLKIEQQRMRGTLTRETHTHTHKEVFHFYTYRRVASSRGPETNEWEKTRLPFPPVLQRTALHQRPSKPAYKLNVKASNHLVIVSLCGKKCLCDSAHVDLWPPATSRCVQPLEWRRALRSDTQHICFTEDTLWQISRLKIYRRDLNKEPS